jgi:hypothetical protein
VGVGDAVEEAAMDVAEDAEVGVGVTVTLNVVGMTVVMGTFWLPDRVNVVTVTGLVVSTTDAFCDTEGVEEEEADTLELAADCAETGANNRMPARKDDKAINRITGSQALKSEPGANEEEAAQ